MNVEEILKAVSDVFKPLALKLQTLHSDVECVVTVQKDGGLWLLVRGQGLQIPYLLFTKWNEYSQEQCEEVYARFYEGIVDAVIAVKGKKPHHRADPRDWN